MPLGAQLEQRSLGTLTRKITLDTGNKVEKSVTHCFWVFCQGVDANRNIAVARQRILEGSSEIAVDPPKGLGCDLDRLELSSFYCPDGIVLVGAMNAIKRHFAHPLEPAVEVVSQTDA